MSAQSVYDSPLLNLGLTLASASLVLVMATRRMRFLQAWTVLFAFEIALDAYLTGSASPLRASMLGTVAVPFVIAGDLRFFLLAERFARAPDPAARTARATLPAAVAWSLVVPVVAFNGFRLFAPAGANMRWLFLAYELLFFALGGFYVFAHLRRRLASGAHARVRRWVLRSGYLALAVYALWITADVLILAGYPSALLLRIVPNLLYYAAFVPFVWHTAPYEARA